MMLEFRHVVFKYRHVDKLCDRNLSSETDEDDLSTFMSQFGDVLYCRVVVDPTTDHPKGTVPVST